VYKINTIYRNVSRQTCQDHTVEIQRNLSTFCNHHTIDENA